MIDANLIKWLKASICKYFSDAKGSYNLYISGTTLDPTQNNQSWAELHFSAGPDIDENSKDDYSVDLTITIMCSALPSNDIYSVDKIAGYFAHLASQPILISKLGGDDGSAVGCLQATEPIRVTSWGLVQLDTKSTPIEVHQTHIEAQYHMSF